MHAGGASVAVRETFEVDGQVVMYDVFAFGNVESPCGQIGRDSLSVAEVRIFFFTFFKGAMISCISS